MAVEKDPAGHGEQSASDDRFAPAPRAARSGLSFCLHGFTAGTHSKTACVARTSRLPAGDARGPEFQMDAFSNPVMPG